jgi:hypothetical protein
LIPRSGSRRDCRNDSLAGANGESLATSASGKQPVARRLNNARTKIIFSDIDSVLNCGHTPNPRKFPYIVDPKLVERVRSVIDETGAQIVLSSTWRYDPAGLFSARHWGIPFIDVTPDCPKEPGATRLPPGSVVIPKSPVMPCSMTRTMNSTGKMSMPFSPATEANGTDVSCLG